MTLPETLDKRIEEELRNESGGSEPMRYVDYFERKYTRIGQRSTLKRQFRKKVGDLPDWADTKIQNADDAHLDRWTDAILTENSIERVLSA